MPLARFFQRSLILACQDVTKLKCRTLLSPKSRLGLGLTGPKSVQNVLMMSTDMAAQQPKEQQNSLQQSNIQEQQQEIDKDKENVDWLMVTETEKYEMGKRWLATMMGEDVETFTDEKIAEALQYLLPSHLFAKDARPSMKHPLELFGKRKELQTDKKGRPLDAGFYTGQPIYHKLLYDIWENLEKLDQLPPVKPEEHIPESESVYDKPLLVRWVKQHEMEGILDCKLAESQFDLLIRRLTRIVKHPHGESMQGFLSKYQVSVTEGEKKLEVLPIDEDGYVTAMGYRKEATAEVKVKEGSGKLMINTQPMTKYFKEISHRQQVISPLLTIGQLGRFDVDAGVIGGGFTGQAGAVRLGLSRALLSFSESFHKPLDEAGLLIRDSRVVERKKAGRKKARKKFAWVKR